MELKITDDNGFIALVNESNYQGFVSEDWQFDRLLTQFVNQMNEGNIIIWQTSNNGGGNWLISFQDHPSDKFSFRQFEHLINVTSGQLFLTNYSDLTNADLKIKMENGWYKVTVRQLFDPNNALQNFDVKTEENVSFEIIISPSRELGEETVNKIYWNEF